MTGGTVYCVACGASIGGDWRHCRTCGAKQPTGLGEQPSFGAATADDPPPPNSPSDVDGRAGTDSSADPSRVAKRWAGLWGSAVLLAVFVLLALFLPVKPQDIPTYALRDSACRGAALELIAPTTYTTYDTNSRGGRDLSAPRGTYPGACSGGWFGLFDPFISGTFWGGVVFGVLWLIGRRRTPIAGASPWFPYRRRRTTSA